MAHASKTAEEKVLTLLSVGKGIENVVPGVFIAHTWGL